MLTKTKTTFVGTTFIPLPLYKRSKSTFPISLGYTLTKLRQTSKYLLAYSTLTSKKALKIALPTQSN